MHVIPDIEKLPLEPATSQAQLLLVLNAINNKLLTGTSYEKLLDLVFDSLDLVIPYDRIGIAIVEGENNETLLSLKWVRSKVSATHLNRPYSAPVNGSSLQKILEAGEPRVINDLIEYSASHPQSESTKLIIKDGIRSSLTCPLRSRDRQAGVIFFSSCKLNTYRDEHIRIFQEIADELSMIIDHGRLRRDFDAAKAQTRNLNMILHDLKSPLSTIQGFAELSLGEPWFKNLDPDGKEVFQVFLRNSKYMFDLLNELNEIGNLDQRAESLDKEDVLLAEFCNEMINFGKILAEQKKIDFISAPFADPSVVARFDRHKVRRVLDNLFSNAVKYSSRGSKIIFTTDCTPKRLTFSVTDSGLGIPESELPKLFQEFGKTTVRPTEGETSTGLGLAIAKKIVEQHEGKISVISAAGSGSTFTFWIPLNGDLDVH